MTKKTSNQTQLTKLFIFIIFGLLFVFSMFFITQFRSNKRLSYNWKTYTEPRLSFKVKIPLDMETRIVPAGFDNGLGFGEQGISRVEFFNKEFSIDVSPFQNARSDKTIKSLIEVRSNVTMGTCCSEKDEIRLQNGSHILLENNYLQNGEKYGMYATILGNKLFYNIDIGNYYNPNFTHDQEMIFMEFLNTFQSTDKE